MKRYVALVSKNYEWASHAFIIPSLVQSLEKAGVEIYWIKEPLHKRPKIPKHIASGVDGYICLPALHQSFTIVKRLREQGNQTPVTIYNTANMACGGTWLFALRKFLTSNDTVVSCSSPEEWLLSQALTGCRVEVIPYAVDIGFQSQQTKARAREFLKIAQKEKIMIYVGRLTEQKNILTLLEAFSKARKKNPDLKLKLIGEFAQDLSLPGETLPQIAAYKKKVHALITKKKLKNHVELLGALDRKTLGIYIKAADVMISLTVFRAEEFGFALAEGMAMGVPAIVSRWGGGVDLIERAGAIGIPVEMTAKGPAVDVFEASNIIAGFFKSSKSVRKPKSLPFDKTQVSLAWKKLLKRPLGAQVKAVGFSPSVKSYLLELLSMIGTKDLRETISDTGYPSDSPFLKGYKHWYFQMVGRAYAGNFPIELFKKLN